MTKPTDEERREVAARLRELPTDVYGVGEQWRHEGVETECQDQTDYYLIHQALFGCLPAEHMHPCDYKEMHARLAYLIESAPERTCRKLPPFDSRGRYTLTTKYASGFEYSETLAYARCSECGTHFCADFAYCPYCGAKVVD